METDSSKDTSRISITAHHTGYTWFANGLSHPAFATLPGGVLYYLSKPWMFMGRTVLGLSDLETALLQRHLILDHLLEEAVARHGATQVVELACGLSPRGFRFKKAHPREDMIYVEADLPPMAARKKALLSREGLLGPGHHVAAVNILVPDGEESLQGVARKYLDPGKPTVVITEGIINYFDMDSMRDLWARIARVLGSFSGGVYLSDNMPRQSGHPFYFILKSWNRLVSLVARGGFHMHFTSEAEMARALAGLGFDSARGHAPEAFAKTLSLPTSRMKSFLQVIEARVKNPERGGTPPPGPRHP